MANVPLAHCLLSCTGLAVLVLFRCVLYWCGEFPSSPSTPMQIIGLLSDFVCWIVGLSLAVSRTDGWCVRHVCVGTMLTLIFTLTFLDCASLLTYATLVAPQPTSPEPILIDQMQAVLSSWACVLVSSVAFNVASCTSCWRVYKALRLAGNYPPNNDNFRRGLPPTRISPLEIMFEEEDLALMSTCGERAGNVCGGSAAVDQDEVRTPVVGSTP